MKLRWFAVALLLAALPATLQARWIQDKVIYETKAAGKVEFSHYNHLEAVGKNCPSCHNSIFHIVAEKNPTFTMADMEKGKSCGACHNGTRAFGVKEDCSSCHPTRDVTFKVPDAGDVLFSHDVHTGMFGCSDCHPHLFVPGPGNKRVTMGRMEKGSSCGACHDGGSAFTVKDNCDTCHQM